MFCVTDRVSEFHAADHVSESGVCDQQVGRPSVLADTGFKVCKVPGVAHPGACEYVTKTHACTLFTLNLFCDGV